MKISKNKEIKKDWPEGKTKAGHREESEKKKKDQRKTRERRTGPKEKEKGKRYLRERKRDKLLLHKIFVTVSLP
jgi:hypothetical protein